MDLTNMTFDELWNVEVDFNFSDNGLPGAWSYSLCRFAKEYAEWANELCTKTAEEPNLVAVNQAMLQLTKLYFEWRDDVEVREQHRNHIGRRGHICFYQVFDYFYHRLKKIESAILPQVIAMQPQPRIAGIFLGEEEA